MSDLQRRFIQLREEMPIHGDVIVLWYAVKGMGYSPQQIRSVFNVWVSKTEYDVEDKIEILDYLFKASLKPVK